jgi:hypothetical protein
LALTHRLWDVIAKQAKNNASGQLRLAIHCHVKKHPLRDGRLASHCLLGHTERHSRGTKRQQLALGGGGARSLSGLLFPLLVGLAI